MNEYIAELKRNLNKLNQADLDDIISYYQNYLADGGIEDYEQCVKELGTPKVLANKILADDSINAANQQNRQARNQSNNSAWMIWLIIIAIVGSPLWIPLSLAVLAVIFAMIVVSAALIFSLGAVIFAGFVSCITMIGWALTHLSTNFELSILILGGSLVGIGISILLIPVIVYFTKSLVHGIQNVSIWFYSKVVKRNKAEEKRNQ